MPVLLVKFIVGWKPTLYWLFAPNNQSFRNKSSKTQPIPTKFGIRGQIKGWQLSRNLGRDRPILGKMEAGTSPAEPKFFCMVIHATFRQLRNGRFSPNLAGRHISVSRRWIRKDIFENFHFRGYLPQNLKSKIGQRGTSLSAGYRSRDALQRDTVYSIVVQGPGSFRGRVNFSARRRPTVAELRGVKVTQFSDFGLFSHTKPLKRTFRWPAYSPGVTSQNDYNFYRASAYWRAILI